MSPSELRALVVLWCGYASLYLLRKPVGVGKAALGRDLNVSRSELGMLDTAMLVPYALVQLFYGSIGDQLGARKTFTACLLGSAFSMVTFGWWSSFYFLCVLLALNGSCQSLAWGACTKAISMNVSEASQTKALGLFATSSFAGGILGSALAIYLLRDGWQSMFTLPAMIVAGLAAAVWYFLVDKPPVSSKGDVEHLGGGDDTSAKKAVQEGEDGQLTFGFLVRQPLLMAVAMSYFTVKLVRYSFYMWLPMYLSEHLGYDEGVAGMVALVFEIGGVGGSALLGWLVDGIFGGQKLPATIAALQLCSVSLLLFMLTSTWGLAANALFMLAAGMGNCGVDSILSGTLPIHFAKTMEASGLVKQDPTTQLSSFVNGIGSLGGMIEGVLIGLIADMFGWNAVFVTMWGLSCAAWILLTRVKAQLTDV